MTNFSLLQGNEAIARAAIRAGLNFYGGYPITPSSEIMHFLAEAATKKKDLHFIQFEDELASINGLIGAALGGAKAMTATSGPGFSLMQEGLGLAHMASIPLVVVDVQRVGPSTGMPTMPAQGDILQAYHGSHGDYVSLCLAPSSVEECYFYTIQGFNLSQEAQLPVILLSDAYLGHLYETVDLAKFENIKITSSLFKPFGKGQRHFTGLISDNGIPKTNDSEFYQEWFRKKKQNVNQVIKNYEFFEYIPNKKADGLIISYGVVSRFLFPYKNYFALFRPIRLFPVLEKQLIKAAKNYSQIIVVEMNDGQYAQIIEQVLKRKVKRICLFGGRIYPEVLKKRLTYD